MWLRFLSKGDEVLCVAAPQLLRLAGVVEPLDGVLANRLEHPEAFLGPADEALLDKRLEEIHVRIGHVLRDVEREAPGEDGQPCEQALLLRRQEAVRPLDRRPECLLARVGVPSPFEKVEPLTEALEDLARREHPRPCGCELDGEREVVERATELVHRLVAVRPGPRREERNGLRVAEWQNRVLDLPPDAEQFPARHEQLQVEAGLDERGKPRCGVDHLLQVVEEQQELALADVLPEPVLGAEGLGDLVRHECRVADRREADPENPRLELRNERRRRLEREPGLARATGPSQRQQSGAVLQQQSDLADLLLPTDERAGRPRQVRVEIVLSGGNSPSPSW